MRSTPYITVATDGSPSANRAIDAAASLTKAIGGCLHILTIGGDVSSVQLRRIAMDQGDLSNVLETAANQILERARKRALRHGLSEVKLEAAWGDPAQAIIEKVQREKTDILVVGRRGRSRLSGLLLGSISQKLTSLAPCNVMVVP